MSSHTATIISQSSGSLDTSSQDLSTEALLLIDPPPTDLRRELTMSCTPPGMTCRSASKGVISLGIRTCVVSQDRQQIVAQLRHLWTIPYSIQHNTSEVQPTCLHPQELLGMPPPSLAPKDHRAACQSNQLVRNHGSLCANLCSDWSSALRKLGDIDAASPYTKTP